MLNAVPMPLIHIGQGERVEAANELAKSLFGQSMVGRFYGTVLRQPALLDCVQRALVTGTRAEARFDSRDASSETVYRVIALPLDGGVLLSLENIGHVEEAGQMRRDFVANVSHELRTPLTAMLGFIETLRGAARDDAKTRERFLDIMATEAGRMNRLIQDLLSLSRVEAEERRRPTGQVDVAAIIASATTMLAPLAKDAGVTLSVSNADSAQTIPGDADQLRQVFTNLIENAIKYGQSDVKIVFSRVDRDAALRGPALIVSVCDNGEGIEAFHIPRLTERFYRVDSHRSRENGGTGLGLAIVKHIVSRHRGRLRVQSTPGKGSSFTVVLPGDAVTSGAAGADLGI